MGYQHGNANTAQMQRRSRSHYFASSGVATLGHWPHHQPLWPHHQYFY